MTSTTPTLYTNPSSSQISHHLASHILALSTKAIQHHNAFFIALSGGSLPKLLSSSNLSSADFSKWHVFFADERCVPLSHPDSNYGLCKSLLFDNQWSNIPSSQIHTLNELLSTTPVEAAIDYDHQLMQSFTEFNRVENNLPVFDCILLGMGPDGHTCSLFPNHRLLNERVKRVESLVDSPKLPLERITLTFPVVNAAGNVTFVVTGEGKKEVLREMFVEGKVYPATMVRPTNGSLVWFLDEPAAQLLPASSKKSYNL